MKLTSTQEEKLLRLARHEGWEVLRDVLIQSWKESATRSLTQTTFSDLLEVGRLQGELMAFSRVVNALQRRHDEALKGD